jgi:hypothetical protein
MPKGESAVTRTLPYKPRTLTVPVASSSELKQSIIRGRGVYLHEFHKANTTREIVDRTFEDSVIIGPAVMFGENGSCYGNTFPTECGAPF